jgi:hypothetical protein
VADSVRFSAASRADEGSVGQVSYTACSEEDRRHSKLRGLCQLMRAEGQHAFLHHLSSLHFVNLLSVECAESQEGKGDDDVQSIAGCLPPLKEAYHNTWCLSAPNVHGKPTAEPSYLQQGCSKDRGNTKARENKQ